MASAPTLAFAYLDPGSGSILLYALAGMAATAVYSLRGALTYAFHALVHRGERRSQHIESDLIIHSEGPQYDHMFLPLLVALTEGREDTVREGTGQDASLSATSSAVTPAIASAIPPTITYVTQYPRSPESAPLPSGIQHIVVGSGLSGYLELNRARGKVFLTTTPQLDVMMFKRSPHVVHYAYIFHAPTDISSYKPFAFDFFDSILCVAPFMYESIRRLEELRNQSPKQLLSTGVLYYDSSCIDIEEAANTLSSRETQEPEVQEKPTVLFAPSWGQNSLFTRYGTAFLSGLSTRHQIIIRPHPQIAISQADIYAQLVHACETYGFKLDLQPSNAASMEAADILISDFSGALYDFHYLYQKPVIVMDTALNFDGFEGRLLETPLWEDRTRSEIGRAVGEDDLDHLSDIIDDMLASPPVSTDFRDRYLANFGQAAPVAAQQLHNLIAETSRHAD